MPRIAGHDLPGEKKITYALRYIYGVGLTKAQEIVKQAKIDPDKRANKTRAIQMYLTLLATIPLIVLHLISVVSMPT